ncbi:tumor protein D52 isoform X2 [Dunckerocampus dactyliophorus]|uniref:tumor protein D52 isoform X2 n=2 Tax=Dunckerocampus dactyliophorus TaxID=161453 RepID=UPI002406164A|nr:tumor protein D52 isoform X2 [Dunckerocampus dactyliophorus]
MEALEEYRSPFDFEQGVNASYLYLSPACSDTPPSSPAPLSRGHQQQHLLHPVAEVGQDAAMTVGPPSPPLAMTEEERQDLQIELLKVEDEIQTLSQVLAAKERQLADIKRKLGVTPLNELKHNFTKTWQEVTTSSAYKRTSETLSHAGLKATAAFSNVGSAISRKLEDVRNAPSFKSFGEKVETWKSMMSPSASSGDVIGEQESGAPSREPEQEDMPSQETPMH